MPVSHVFSCLVPDNPANAAAGDVLPSHWNSSHSVVLDTSEVIKWISAGAQSVSSGTVVFSNSNGVSFGMNAGTITATVVPGAAAGIAAVQAGTQTATSGTVVFANSNGISFALSGSSQITASYTVPSTAGLISAVNVSGGTTSGNLTQIVFVDSNRVSFGLNAGSITAKHALNFSAGTTSQNISDQIVFSNSNGLAFGLNGSTVTGSYTVPSTAGLLSAINASAGTTSNNLSAIVFSNSNNVSFGLNGSTVTGTASFAQTNQSAIKGFGASNTGNTAGNTGLSTGIDWVLAGSNNITISQSTVGGGPNTLWVSGAAAGGAQTAISGLANSETTYTSGSVYLSERANITINSSANGASQYYRFSVAAQSNQSAIKGFGVSNTGQTAGNTGLSTGIDWVLAGSQSITLSQSTVGGGPNTVWMQHPAWLTTAMQSDAATLSNIRVSAGTTSNLLSAVTFADSNGLSFGLNASTVTGGLVPLSFYEPRQLAASGIGLQGEVRAFHLGLQYAGSFTQCNVPISFSFSTSSNSSHAGSITVNIGIYTRNGSTLSLASSGSQSYAWSNTSNNSTSVIANIKMATVPINMNATPGDYWGAFVVRTSTANASWYSLSAMRINNLAGQHAGTLLQASNATGVYFAGRGSYSVTSIGLPASMAFTEIQALGNEHQAQPYMNFVGT